ncbi:MAG: MerR family DNA-binding transcriptional regulator, partial [Rhodospirillales bacterium]|nr:MerR family DNA-binding transcriptional regulator [Rhodospirillales bacterium]
MNIGQASELSGIPSKTIRYYESIGLIPAPARTDSGYRDYSQPEIETMRFIQRARNLGFTIKDVCELVDLWQDQHRASAQVKALTQRHISDIENKIKKLDSMRHTLVTLADKCH